MYSSRKYNVERHIERVHPGIGDVISFIEFLAEVKTGNYIPKPPPAYKKSNGPNKIFTEEFYRELARQCASKSQNLNKYYLMNLLESFY